MRTSKRKKTSTSGAAAATADSDAGGISTRKGQNKSKRSKTAAVGNEPSGGATSAAASASSQLSSSTTTSLQPSNILLSTPADSTWLSPSLCLLRSQIEYFAACPSDLTAKNRSGGNKAAVVIGQVGIRCIWCNHRPRGDRAKGSELYPSNIGLIHQAVRNYQRHHYKACPHIPATIRDQIEAAKSVPGKKRQSKSNSKDFWSDSARAVGLFDNEHRGKGGISFDAKKKTGKVEAAAKEEVEEEKKEEEEEGQMAEEAWSKFTASLLPRAAPFRGHRKQQHSLDSMSSFGLGLGLGLIIDDRDNDDTSANHDGAAAAAVPASVGLPVHVIGGPAAASWAPQQQAAEIPADDASLGAFDEALAILSDEADDDDSLEPTPLNGGASMDNLHHHHAHSSSQVSASTGPVTAEAMYLPPHSQSSRQEQINANASTGTDAFSSATASAAYADLFSPTPVQRDQYQYQQPRRHSMVAAIPAAIPTSSQVQDQYHQLQQQQHYRRFSLPGSIYQAATDQQHRQHVQSFSPLAMPLPLPITATYNGVYPPNHMRRSSIVSSCSSPGFEGARGAVMVAAAAATTSPVTPSTSSWSSSYGLPGSDATEAHTTTNATNKRARYE